MLLLSLFISFTPCKLTSTPNNVRLHLKFENRSNRNNANIYITYALHTYTYTYTYTCIHTYKYTFFSIFSSNLIL